MCNTRSYVFLQSMKSNPLSVKKLTKNLVLRALRQLYATSEIIILIWWVTPPSKVENLQFEFFPQFWNSSIVHILQLCIILTVSIVFLHYIYKFMSSIAFTYCYFFKLLFLLSECDRTLSPSMLNSTQSIHKFFMPVLFETRSKSSLCPCQLKNLWTELLTRSNHSASHEILIYSPTI